MYGYIDDTDGKVLKMGFKKARMSAKLTQEKLANLLGVSRSTVAMWEIGESNPRVSTLKKLAMVLDCTVDELLQEDPG